MTDDFPIERASPAELAQFLRIGVDAPEVREAFPSLALCVEEAARRLDALAMLGAMVMRRGWSIQ